MTPPLEKREKAIVLIMYTILRQDIQNQDFETKLEALHSMLIACDIHILDKEIEEIVYLANDLMIFGRQHSTQKFGQFTPSKIEQAYDLLEKKLGMKLTRMKL